MNIQQMMMQAQKMQREMQKAQQELAAKEFTVSKSGAVTVTLFGDKTIKEIKFDEDAIDPENKDMLEELVTMAINEALEQISKEEEKISSKATGGMGLPF